MMRVLWQLVTPAQELMLVQVREELRAHEIEVQGLNDPALDLAPYAAVHFFGWAPAPLALRCAFNAIRQEKPFVVTLLPAMTPAQVPTPEIAAAQRALADAAEQFLVRGAAFVFSASDEAETRANALGALPTQVRQVSADAYTRAYREGRGAAESVWRGEDTKRPLEDAAIHIARLARRADDYYYQQLTPQLEREAARAAELERELLDARHRRL